MTTFRYEWGGASMIGKIKELIARLLSRYPVYRLTAVLFAIAASMSVTVALSDRFSREASSVLTSSQAIPISIFAVMTIAVGFAAVLTLFSERLKGGDDFERELAAIAANLEPTTRQAPKPSAKAEDLKKVYDKTIGVGYISTIFSKSRINLKSELRKARGAAGQALLFGIFFCFVALGCTIYFIYTGSTLVTVETSLYQFLMYYLPRLSVALVAQIVALFFLNLSIINQRDARSIRNEVTNLDMREAGVVLALLHDDAATSALVADHLAKTERNFLLRRGERVMHEGDQYERLSDQLAGLAKLIEAAKPAK